MVHRSFDDALGHAPHDLRHKTAQRHEGFDARVLETWSTPTRREHGSVLALQRAAGNHAVASLLLPETGPNRFPRTSARPPARHLSTGRAATAQRCGCVGPGPCACHAKTVESAKGAPTVQRVDYANEHRCGAAQTARIFSSWAVATTKLMENLPALEVSWATGLASKNLKDNRCVGDHRRRAVLGVDGLER